MQPPDDMLQPFAQDGELARLLRAERADPGPDAATRDRMWSRLTPALSLAAAPRAFGATKVAAIVAIAGVALIGWRMHARSGTTVASVSASPVPSPVPSASASPSPSPSPSLSLTLSPSPVPSPSEPPRRVHPRPTDSLAEERRVVDGARESLAHGDPRGASAALADHAHRFPRGQLAEERESLLIRADLTLGHADRAGARADAFLARHPDSLFAPIVRVLAARAHAAALPVE